MYGDLYPPHFYTDFERNSFHRILPSTPTEGVHPEGVRPRSRVNETDSGDAKHLH